MSVISNETKDKMLVAQAQRFTRLGREMTAWDLIQAEDLGWVLLKSKDWTLQGIGKHLIRFVNEILSE